MDQTETGFRQLPVYQLTLPAIETQELRCQDTGIDLRRGGSIQEARAAFVPPGVLLSPGVLRREPPTR